MVLQRSANRLKRVMKPLRQLVDQEVADEKAEVRDLYDAQVSLNLLFAKVSADYDDMFKVIIREFSDLFLHFKSHRDCLVRINDFLMNGGMKFGHAYRFLIDEKMRHEQSMQQAIENIEHALYLLNKEKGMKSVIEQVHHHLGSVLEKLKKELGEDSLLKKKGLDSNKEIMDLRMMIAKGSA